MEYPYKNIMQEHKEQQALNKHEITSNVDGVDIYYDGIVWRRFDNNEIMDNNRIKLFTHSDMDGIGCQILAMLGFGENNVDTEVCNYSGFNAINDKFQLFMESKEYNNYSKIFITDISISDENVELIKSHGIEDKILLFDHHETALRLNDYDWCQVYVNHDNPKSGTMLFWEHLLNEQVLHYTRSSQRQIKEFVNMVSDYDTWMWNKNEDIIPKQLNELFTIYGKDRFVQFIIDTVFNSGLFVGETQKLLLELERTKIDKYIWKKNKSLIKANIYANGLNYLAGVVFAENYISELGNELSKLNPHLDFIAIINPDSSISYRTIRENIDLSLISKYFGGGGHKQASGSGIDKELNINYIESLFQKK